MKMLEKVKSLLHKQPAPQDDSKKSEANEAIPSIDQQPDRKAISKVMVVGVVICIGVLGWIGYNVVSLFSESTGYAIAPLIPDPHILLDENAKEGADNLDVMLQKKNLESAYGSEEVITPEFSNVYDRAEAKKQERQKEKKVEKKDSVVVKPLTADEQKALARKNTPKSSGSYRPYQYKKPKKSTQEENGFMARTVSETKITDENENEVEPDVELLIPAVVNKTQKVRNGQRVTFRLQQEATINGRFIPRNALVTATAYLGSDRVNFKVSSISFAGEIVPAQKLKLKCFDLDMMEGLAYISDDAIKRGVKQQGRYTAANAVGDALTVLPYTTGGRLARSTGRGVTSAVANGSATNAQSQIILQDGYKVFFMPSN